MVSFSDIVSLNTICPSAVFSITHLGKQPEKRKGQVSNQKTLSSDGGATDPRLSSKVTMNKYLKVIIFRASFLSIKRPFNFKKDRILIYSTSARTFTPFIRDSWWQLKWLNHPAKPIFSLLAH